MSTEKVSVDGHTITIEINITPSKESKPEVPGRTDITDVIDDYSVAPIKETRSSNWMDVDLATMRSGTYLNSKTGDAFFKTFGSGRHRIDKYGNLLNSAEVAAIVRNAFNLRTGIYFVTYPTDRSLDTDRLP